MLLLQQILVNFVTNSNNLKITKFFRMYSKGDFIYLPVCQNLGEEDKHCHEKCSMDGTTCLLSIELDKCTCNGIHLNLQETIKLDFENQKIMQSESKFKGTFGSGYAKKCGDCSRFCPNFPGEERGLNSTQRDFSCL